MKNLLDIPRTAMEVFEMLPEGTACEVIDNTLYMSPSPTTVHQRLLFKLARNIQDFAEGLQLGEVILSPCDVYLNEERDVVQPDIFFIKRDRQFVIKTKGVIGAPDFIIEILSSNKVHDQQRKFELYQQSRIPEYIIIDPETKNVWSYVLQGDKYEEKQADPGKLFVVQLGLEILF